MTRAACCKDLQIKIIVSERNNQDCQTKRWTIEAIVGQDDKYKKMEQHKRVEDDHIRAGQIKLTKTPSVMRDHIIGRHIVHPKPQKRATTKLALEN